MENRNKLNWILLRHKMIVIQPNRFPSDRKTFIGFYFFFLFFISKCVLYLNSIFSFFFYKCLWLAVASHFPCQSKIKIEEKFENMLYIFHTIDSMQPKWKWRKKYWNIVTLLKASKEEQRHIFYIWNETILY